MVKLDGSAQKMWQNWRCDNIHRVTCYGNLTQELSRFCRFMKLNLTDEANPKTV